MQKHSCGQVMPRLPASTLGSLPDKKKISLYCKKQACDLAPWNNPAVLQHLNSTNAEQE